MTAPWYSTCITELATEMPRCFSISIQSEVAWREALRALTLPAIWIAPANSSSFSVSVVLPASGWEMMAKVRRRATSAARDGTRAGAFKGGSSAGRLAPRILAGRRVGDRLFQREALAPLLRRTDPALRADLIQAPVDFQPVHVRIAELHRDLAAGAAPAFEFDLHALLAQPVARAE